MEALMLSLLTAAQYPLKPWDIGFFVVCAVIVAVIVAVYFLIPVINRKQYQEMRENLEKRELAFKAKEPTAEEENTAAIDDTAAVEKTDE